MKQPLIYLVCLLFANALGLHANWRLTWSDEFNTLDVTKWNLRNQPGNFGNKELQWYSPDQISVSNGYLSIAAKKQDFGGMSYVSGRMDSQDKAYFTYGRYEFRAKMSGGKGMWPAIWLLSQNKCWGSGGEVDIAEFRGSYPTALGTFYHYSSQCCLSFSNCISSKGTGKNVGVGDLSKDYHVYAFEWWPSNMSWFIDDKLIESYQTSSLTITQDTSPHYWVINSAVGGSYPGNPDSSTVFPNYLSVDYIRNYVWRQSCSGVTCSGNGCCDSRTVTCKCNPGYAGANCEQNLQSASNNFNIISSLDNVPNGWGNDYTLYLTKNTAVASGALKFTITNAGCPGSCGNKPYSAGAWESIPRYTYGTFTFRAKTTKISGTGFSLSIAGESTSILEQIAFSFVGSNPSNVQLWTWTGGWPYKQADININFDPIRDYHSYAIKWAPSQITWYIDSVQVWQINGVTINATRLGPGAYYTAQPDWYGPFSYTGSSAAYLTNFQWTMTAAPAATCN